MSESVRRSMTVRATHATFVRADKALGEQYQEQYVSRARLLVSLLRLWLRLAEGGFYALEEIEDFVNWKLSMKGRMND